MKHLKQLLSVALVLCPALAFASLPTTTQTALCPTASYFSIRSQGSDLADWLSGWTQHINLYDQDHFNWSFYIKPKYTRSFRSNDICSCLFGVSNCNNNCNTNCCTTTDNTTCIDACGNSVASTGCCNNNNTCGINVTGSRVANRGATDLLADNFYLPTDFSSRLTFKPRIENVVVDMQAYFGFDECTPGLFLRVDLPVVWTNWNLNFCECVTSTGGNAADAGYYACNAIPATSLLHNFSSYANGSAPAFTDPTTPVALNGLNFSRFDNCSHSRAGVAELRVLFGYNFLNCEDYHLGLALSFAAPTGNRPCGRRLFEPIVGNGKHWELGAFITSHYTFWRSCDEDSTLGLYLDANITHLFNARQTRTFDLKCKPLSRYMLAEQFTTPVVGGLVGTACGGTAPTAQFANVLMPVANFTTQDVNVSAAVQADLALQLTWTKCNWAFDLGYNFWTRSCEKIRCRTSCNTSCEQLCNPCGIATTPVTFAEGTFGLKGDAYLYGYRTNAPGAAAACTCVPLSATESTATINAGTNFAATGASTPALVAAGQVNPGVNAAALAFGNSAAGVCGTLATVACGGAQVNTSVQPVLITAADIDNCNGTRGLSNKVYGHLSYQWLDHDCWVPFVGLGGFAEFGANTKCGSNCDTNCNTSCNTNCSTACNTNCNTNCSTNCCNTCSLSQWGLWVKFGGTFN